MSVTEDAKRETLWRGQYLLKPAVKKKGCTGTYDTKFKKKPIYFLFSSQYFR